MDEPISDGLNAAANVLNTEPARNLLSPATKEIGLTLGSIAGAFRLCVEENLEKLSPKWARQRQNRPLTLDEVRTVMPFLQAASLCSDDELQERWAALLESSVTTPEDVLPSFGQTLSQLTAEEARFLEQLHERRQEMGEISSLVRIYDPMLPHMFIDDVADERNAHVRLMIQDVERLGLIAVEHSVKEIRNTFMRPMESFVKKLGHQQLKSEFIFTEYGLSFIRAVKPKN